MPNSQQVDLFGFVASFVVLTGVGVMANRAIVSLKEKEEHHSIPWEDKKRLTEKYGKWAVNRAESQCPHNDVACVEREARISLEVMRHRRGT